MSTSKEYQTTGNKLSSKKSSLPKQQKTAQQNATTLNTDNDSGTPGAERYSSNKGQGPAGENL